MNGLGDEFLTRSAFTRNQHRNVGIRNSHNTLQDVANCFGTPDDVFEAVTFTKLARQKLDLPFELALTVLATVVSVNPRGWIVADAGLKALGMDHGDPSWSAGDVLFCSDEHVTLVPASSAASAPPAVGDRIRLEPAHVDPTVAKHEVMWVVDGRDVVDRWPVDLRHW